MLDHYLHTAHAAALALSPARRGLTLPPPRPGAAATALTGRAQALAWLRAEYQVLLRAVACAATEGFDAHAWQLGWSLVVFLHREGHWQDLLVTQQMAVAAAVRLGDQAAQAHSEPGLARALALHGLSEEAIEHLHRALGLFRQLGDTGQQAGIHLDMGQVAESRGRHRDALGHCEHALPLFRAAGDRSGEARALNNIGWFHGALGNHQRAATFCGQAVRLYEEVGEWAEQAAAWDSLGRARHLLGQYPEALDCLHRAIDLHLESGDRAARASSLAHAGDTYLAAGNPGAAHASWRQALSLLDDLGHPDVTQVRARLDRAGHAAGTAGPPSAGLADPALWATRFAIPGAGAGSGSSGRRSPAACGPGERLSLCQRW